jgi:hypothetical protein
MSSSALPAAGQEDLFGHVTPDLRTDEQAPAPRTRRRATRVPADLPAQLNRDPVFLAWFRRECPAIAAPATAKYHMSQFMDYWTAKSGQAATKTDWVATARRWFRTEQDRAGQQPAGNARANGHRSRVYDNPADQDDYDRRPGQ